MKHVCNGGRTVLTGFRAEGGAGRDEYFIFRVDNELLV